MTTPNVPNRTSTAGAEVVALIEATFDALRAERDEALRLLSRVVDSNDALLMDDPVRARIKELLGRS